MLYESSLSHSAKGTTCKDHKYIKKVGDEYYYETSKKMSEEAYANKLEYETLNNRAAYETLDYGANSDESRSALKKAAEAKIKYEKSASDYKEFSSKYSKEIELGRKKVNSYKKRVEVNEAKQDKSFVTDKTFWRRLNKRSDYSLKKLITM